MESRNAIETMLSVHEVPSVLHVHNNTVRKWSNQGIIRAYRINHRGDRRFKHEDIDKYMTGFNRNEATTSYS
jgi:excisionase family DNA binding protein